MRVVRAESLYGQLRQEINGRWKFRVPCPTQFPHGSLFGPEGNVVAVFLKNRQPRISAIEHVLGVAAKTDSQRSSHESECNRRRPSKSREKGPDTF
jgi:hypothetical protein